MPAPPAKSNTRHTNQLTIPRVLATAIRMHCALCPRVPTCLPRGVWIGVDELDDVLLHGRTMLPLLSSMSEGRRRLVAGMTRFDASAQQRGHCGQEEEEEWQMIHRGSCVLLATLVTCSRCCVPCPCLRRGVRSSESAAAPTWGLTDSPVTAAPSAPPRSMRSTRSAARRPCFRIHSDGYTTGTVVGTRRTEQRIRTPHQQHQQSNAAEHGSEAQASAAHSSLSSSTERMRYLFAVRGRIGSVWDAAAMSSQLTKTSLIAIPDFNSAIVRSIARITFFGAQHTLFPCLIILSPHCAMRCTSAWH